MSTYSIYFSPTGGTKKVMDILEEKIPADFTIDLSLKDMEEVNLSEEDICLIGVPSYGGRVPQIALERLRKISGGGAKAVLVVVYGNRAYEDTFLELKNEAEACGFCPVAALAAIAEHSIMHKFAAGRPDDRDREELGRFAAEIRDRISTGNTGGDLKVPGNTPYRRYAGVPFKPQTSRRCNRCGVCVAQCPVQAIPADHPAKTDMEKCISCMRCIAVCPKKARSLNKALLLGASTSMKKACAGRKENELFLN